MDVSIKIKTVPVKPVYPRKDLVSCPHQMPLVTAGCWNLYLKKKNHINLRSINKEFNTVREKKYGCLLH